MTDEAPIRVLICDDHPVVRSGLSALLGAYPDIDVVGGASDGEEAVSMVFELEPNVVLMDVSMPGMDGIEATRRIMQLRPETRVVMLTSFADKAREALENGAVGYLLKDSAPEEVLRGIRSAAKADPPPPPPSGTPNPDA